MSRRTLITSVLLLCVMLSLSLAGISAQMPTAITPDRKALTDAVKIKEPDKKIEALEKVISDFPKSQTVSSAHQAIFETLVKSYPDQKDKILSNADKAIDTAPDFIRPFICSNLGNRLFEASILLDDAERLLKKGLVLTEEAIAKQKSQQESGYYATLGRIYVKQGKLKDAEKSLKRARELNPQLSSASLGLAELYMKRGDQKQALEAYSSAAITSKMTPESRKQLETLYAKYNQGSGAGLDEMLDKKYAQIYPIPVKIEHYTPTAKRTNRTALAEVFTGSGCPPCAAADLGFDAMMERYGRSELTVVMYHLHIPQPRSHDQSVNSIARKVLWDSGRARIRN